LSQFDFIELYSLLIEIPFRQILLPKVLLKLFPRQLLLVDPFMFLRSSHQMEAFLFGLKVATRAFKFFEKFMDSEIFLQFK
jgi:hypothetical protein